MCVCVCVCVCIIVVLVVTKSLCGFMANQVQYNMESAQYLGYLGVADKIPWH